MPRYIVEIDCPSDAAYSHGPGLNLNHTE